jgi:hypothetical protein
MTDVNIKVPGLDQLAEIAKDFLQKTILPPLEEVGLLLSDKVRFYRFKNQVEIVTKAEAYLKEKNIKTKQVSLKILAPLLEQCSLEEEDSLKEKWAALLANTVSEGSELNSTLYSHILGQMTKSDADLFQLLYRNSTTTTTGFKVSITVKEHRTIVITELRKDIKDLDLIIDNLIRLRLIKEDNPFSLDTANVALTNLGFRFMSACTFVEI